MGENSRIYGVYFGAKRPPLCALVCKKSSYYDGNKQITNNCTNTRPNEAKLEANRPNTAKSNTRAQRKTNTNTSNQIFEGDQIYLPMCWCAQLKTANGLFFWSYMPNNAQPALYILVSLPIGTNQMRMLHVINLMYTFGACDMWWKVAKNKYQIRIRIKYCTKPTCKQILPNKAKSNISFWVQIRIK